MMQAVSPPHWMKNWGGGDRKVYETVKNEEKNILIEKAEAVVPRLRSSYRCAKMIQ